MIAILLFAFSWTFVEIDSIQPGIKVLISDNGLKYALGQVAEGLSKEILKINMADIRGSESFSYGILNYTFFDIEINGYTRPDVGLQINPSGSVSLTFSEASVAATASVLCKKAEGAVKFRHSTTVIFSIFGVSVFVNAHIGLDDAGLPVIEATTCSSSIGSIIASFQGDVNSLYNPIARSKKFRRNLHTSLGGAMCNLLTNAINSNGVIGTFKGHIPLIHDSIILDLRLNSDLVFGNDYIESSHVGRFMGDEIAEEAPVMHLLPERMLTFGISEATLNSVARTLHRKGFWSTVVDQRKLKELIPKLKDSNRGNMDLQMIVSSTTPPIFSITPKGIYMRLEIEGVLIDANKNGSQTLASLKMSFTSQLKASLSYRNLTASMLSFVPSVMLDGAVESGGTVFLKEFAVKMSEEVQSLSSRFLKIGMPLPTLEGVLYINDHHKPYNRYLSITCDVIYAP